MNLSFDMKVVYLVRNSSPKVLYFMLIIMYSFSSDIEFHFYFQVLPASDSVWREKIILVVYLFWLWEKEKRCIWFQWLIYQQYDHGFTGNARSHISSMCMKRDWYCVITSLIKSFFVFFSSSFFALYHWYSLMIVQVI